MNADARTKNERGQVLVVFAGSLVMLIAIAAIVLDLGSVWMMKRHEQDAADPGAVAAARYIRDPANGGNPSEPKMWTAACAYALQNGFNPVRSDTTALCDSSGSSDESSITVNYPPSLNAGQYAGHAGFVEVVIGRPDHSFFAGLFGLSTIPVTSAAVAAFSNGDSNSSSLVALEPHACSALQVGGNSTVNIHPTTPGTNGGYIQVNSDCATGGAASDNLCPNGSSSAMKVNGSGTVTAPHTYVRGSCTSPGGGTLLPGGQLTEGADYVGDPLAGLKPPTQGTGAFCAPGQQTGPTGNPAKGCTFSGSTVYDLQPGTYYGGWKISGGNPTLNLHPGIYILAGGGISATTGTIETVAGPTGNPDTARVLIYSGDNIAGGYQAGCKRGTLPGGVSINDVCQQKISFAAGSTLIVKGLNSDPCPPISSTGCPYAGMLMWQDGTGSLTKADSHEIDILAGTNLNISGTIYDPSGLVKLTGSSSTTGCTVAPFNCASVQIIANTITVDGGAGLDMPYDPNGLYHLDQKGLVH